MEGMAKKTSVTYINLKWYNLETALGKTTFWYRSRFVFFRYEYLCVAIVRNFARGRKNFLLD